MRGIISSAGYVPYRRLDLTEIAATAGKGGGRGHRSVACFDEDTTTLGVEAARLALRAVDTTPSAVWFATAEPTYAEKTNSTIIHAALRLDTSVPTLDMTGAARSGVGALRTALDHSKPVLVVSSGIRTGLPGGADEASGGDAGAAILVGDEADGSVIAEYLGSGTATEEFVDRWRVPGEQKTRRWEERFAQTRYVPLGQQAFAEALDNAGLRADQVDLAVVVGTHARAAKALAGKLGEIAIGSDLAGTVGDTGAASTALALTNALEGAEPGQVIAVVTLIDSVEVLLFRATDALATFRPPRTVAQQVASGGAVSYGKFLHWRGVLEVEPPNRPGPDRASSSASARTADWKFGFVGSKGAESGIVHLPPSRASIDPSDPLDTMIDTPMADAIGTVATFTIDRLAYSPSPPIVFAIVDFDGGGRVPVELTDVDADQLSIGDKVEMTFRRLSVSDGIANYFWKARPVRDAVPNADGTVPNADGTVPNVEGAN